jgi:hypothetical protein
MLIGFNKDFQKTGRSIDKTKLFRRTITTAAKNKHMVMTTRKPWQQIYSNIDVMEKNNNTMIPFKWN